jgi:hypothetical protein
MQGFKDFLRMALGWLQVNTVVVPGCAELVVLPHGSAAAFALAAGSGVAYVLPAGSATITLEVC